MKKPHKNLGINLWSILCLLFLFNRMINAQTTPVLEVSPLVLDFGKTESSLNITIKNSGNGTLEWSAEENPNESWLWISNDRTGSLGSGETFSLNVQIDRNEIAYEIVYGEILISSNGGFQAVDLIVEIDTPPTSPELDIIPPVLDFNVGLESLSFTVKNRGEGTLDWAASENPPRSWISSITPASGSLSSMESVEVTVQVTRQGLTDGFYTGLIEISSNAGSKNMEVEMIVGDRPSVIRANVGGSKYIDHENQTFLTDRPYHSGAWGHVRGHYYSISNSIANTSDDELYQTEMFWLDAYRFDVSNGTYQVILHFAELYYNYRGGRVFNTSIEGALVLDHFDIYEEAGFRTATTRTFNVQVRDGRLDIEFEHFAAHAKLSAVEVIASGGVTPILSVTPTELDFGNSDTELSFNIENQGNGTLSWTASENPDESWITSISPSGGSLAENETAQINISVDRDGLINGFYQGVIQILSNGGEQNLSVAMTVGTVANLYRVNTGGPNYSAPGGTSWTKDQPYSAGGWGYVGGSTYSTTTAIDNTNADELYQTERYGMNAYRFDVGNGEYDVVLHFAEIYHTSRNKRIFDVEMEGALVLDNYDIFADAGQNTATQKIFRTTVSDGVLDLEFSASADEAKISAIEIYQLQQGPILLVSPQSLDFGADLTNLEFSIENSGSGTLEWSVSESPEEAWITNISPQSGTLSSQESANVTLEVDRTGLGNGSYSGDLTINSNAGNKNLAISMTVGTNPPVIAVAPGSFSVEGVEGQTNPSSQTLLITNSGGGTLSWTASEAPEVSWLSLTNVTGSSGEGVTLSFDVDGLTVGTYETNIRIEDATASNSPVDVPVLLNVKSPSTQPESVLGAFQAVANALLPNPGWEITSYDNQACVLAMVNSTSGTNDTYRLDFTFDVPSDVNTVYAFGEVNVNGSYKTDSFWITMNGRNRMVWNSLRYLGTGWKREWIFSNGKNTQEPFSVSPGSNTLSIYPRESGAYLNWIVITTDPNFDIQNYEFGGEVEPPEPPTPEPKIAVSASELIFNAIIDGSNPAARELRVTNSGTGSLSWSAFELTEVAWLSLSNTSGGDGDAVEVSVEINGLEVGFYQTTVRIEDDGASNSPVDVPVTLNVKTPSTQPESVLAAFQAEANSLLPNPGWEITTNENQACVVAIVNSTSGADNNYRLDFTFDVPSDVNTVYAFGEIDVNGSYDDDSFWVTLNGRNRMVWNGLRYLGDGWKREWIFSKGKNTQEPFTVSPGSNTLSIYPREDGPALNWLVITTDPNFDIQNFDIEGALAKPVSDDLAENQPQPDRIPSRFQLYRNFPNPFNPTTQITFELPQESLVNITIFNELGQKVTTLLNSHCSAGFHSIFWHATDYDGRLVKSGIYFCRWEAGNQIEVIKMTLIK